MRKAVTLVEVLLVVILSALLMTAVIPFIRSVSDVWSVGSGKTEILQNGRVALETMTRYIRQAKRIIGIPGASGDYIKIRFRNTSNTDWADNDVYNIIFFRNVSGSPYYIGASGIIKDNDLVMRSDATGSYVDSLLAAGVDSFSFNFLQDNGTPATQANQVKSVQIQMVLSDSTGSTTHTLTLEDTVILRQDVRVSAPVWAIDGYGSQNTLRDFSSDIEVSGFNIGTNSGDCLSVNSVDGSCWVADTNHNRVKKVSSTGEVLVDLTGFSRPNALSVNSELLYNGRETVWVADTNGNRVRRIYWTGSNWTYETINVTNFSSPRSVSFDVIGGEETCWVADTSNNRVVKIYRSGSSWDFFAVTEYREGSRTRNLRNVRSVSVDTIDHSCWAAVTGRDRVLHLSSNGDVIGDPISGFSNPRSVSAYSVEHSCYVSDIGTDQVIKIDSSGNFAWPPVSGFIDPYSISVNPTNGACWVADYGHNQVVRLNLDGDEEFRINITPDRPVAVSAKPD